MYGYYVERKKNLELLDFAFASDLVLLLGAGGHHEINLED